MNHHPASETVNRTILIGSRKPETIPDSALHSGCPLCSTSTPDAWKTSAMWGASPLKLHANSSGQELR